LDIFGGTVRSEQVIWLSSLLLAFAFVLWGGRLFRVFVVLLGVGAGVVLGFFLGSVIGLGPQGGVIGAVIGALLLGLLAWPLHKIFVFLIGGLFFGFLAASVAASFQVPQNTLNAAAIAGFVAGGVLSIVIHKPFVIALMAAAGAQSILNVMLGKSFKGMAEFEAFMREYSAFYAQRLGLFLTMVVLYVIFAFTLQMAFAPRPKDPPERVAAKSRLRRLLYLFAFLQLAGWTLTRIAPAWAGFTHSPVTGLSLLSWPVAAIISALALNWIWEGTVPGPGRTAVGRGSTRFIFFIVIGATIAPLVTGVLHRIFFGQSPFLFLYEAALNGPPALQVFKAAYALVVFPSLAVLATRTAAVQQAAAAPASASPAAG